MAKKLPPGKKKIPISVALSPFVVKRIDRMGKALKKSRSEMVESLIVQGIDEHELTAAAMTDPAISQALLQAFAKPEVLRSLSQVMRQDLNASQLEMFSDALTSATEFVSGKHGLKK